MGQQVKCICFFFGWWSKFTSNFFRACRPEPRLRVVAWAELPVTFGPKNQRPCFWWRLQAWLYIGGTGKAALGGCWKGGLAFLCECGRKKILRFSNVLRVTLQLLERLHPNISINSQHPVATANPSSSAERDGCARCPMAIGVARPAPHLLKSQQRKEMMYREWLGHGRISRWSLSQMKCSEVVGWNEEVDDIILIIYIYDIFWDHTIYIAATGVAFKVVNVAPSWLMISFHAWKWAPGILYGPGVLAFPTWLGQIWWCKCLQSMR